MKESPYLYSIAAYKKIFSEEECLKIIGLFNKDADTNILKYSHETAWLFDKIGKCAVAVNRDYFNFSIYQLSNEIELIKADNEPMAHWQIDIGTTKTELLLKKISLIVTLSENEKFLEWFLSFEDVDQKKGNIIFFASYLPYRVSGKSEEPYFYLKCWLLGPYFS